MKTRLLVPLILAAGLLVAVIVNEVTHGGLGEAFGAGHQHVEPHDHDPCPSEDPPGAVDPGGTGDETCPDVHAPEAAP